MPARFQINPEHLASITVVEPISIRFPDGRWETGTSTRSTDHSEFTALRDRLEKLGYITIERGYWNGDRVVKPFYLNDVLFSEGDKFFCALAMGIHISTKTT